MQAGYILIGCYVVVLLVMGLYDRRHIKNFDDYTVAGRKKGALLVAGSLVATCIGASATIGVVNMAYNVGFPAFWWLGSGAIGLIILSWFGAGKLNGLQGLTLPDVAAKIISPWAVKPIAVIIVVGWTGIVAAQFVAVARIFDVFFDAPTWSVLLITFLVISIYACIGGQVSVMRTDSLQLVILLAGLVLLAVIIYLKGQGPLIKWQDVGLVNENFGYSRWFYFLIIIGSQYIVGPDIFSRVFAAKSAKAARRGLIIAGVLLFCASLLIVSIGLGVKAYGLLPPGDNILVAAVNTLLPSWAVIIVLLALLSAIFSSADTCLLAVSTTFTKDILGSQKVGTARISIMVFSFLAFAVALWKQDILELLLAAYTIFGGGVIAPMIVALWAHKRKRIAAPIILLGICLGSVLGVCAVVFSNSNLAILGFAISGVLGLFALRRN